MQTHQHSTTVIRPAASTIHDRRLRWRLIAGGGTSSCCYQLMDRTTRRSQGHVNGHTVTVNGRCETPFGAGSHRAVRRIWRLTANNDYLTLSHADFAFGTGDFAIEMWRQLWAAIQYQEQPMRATCLTSGLLARWMSSFVWPAQPMGQIRTRFFYVNRSNRIVSTTSMGASWKNVTLARISGVSQLFIGHRHAQATAHKTTRKTI